HKLTIFANGIFTEVLIKTGEPESNAELRPVIESVEVLNDKKGKPINLKLTGKNFMLFYKFSYSLIDGEFGFGHQTSVLDDGSFETIVHIPDPKAFAEKTEHSIMYATPFGSAFKTFESN